MRRTDVSAKKLIDYALRMTRGLPLVHYTDVPFRMGRIGAVRPPGRPD